MLGTTVEPRHLPKHGTLRRPLPGVSRTNPGAAQLLFCKSFQDGFGSGKTGSHPRELTGPIRHTRGSDPRDIVGDLRLSALGMSDSELLGIPERRPGEINVKIFSLVQPVFSRHPDGCSYFPARSPSSSVPIAEHGWDGNRPSTFQVPLEHLNRAGPSHQL